MIGIPEGEKKKDRTEKVFKETMAKNFLDLARHNPTVFRRWEKLKQDKPKEIHAKTYHTQTSEM